MLVLSQMANVASIVSLRDELNGMGDLIKPYLVYKHPAAAEDEASGYGGDKDAAEPSRAEGPATRAALLTLTRTLGGVCCIVSLVVSCWHDVVVVTASGGSGGADRVVGRRLR